jgi:hypothetical protein
MLVLLCIIFAPVPLMHCTVLLLAHIISYTLDRTEPKLEEPTEKAQHEDPANLASVFDFILLEIISISRTALRSCGYTPKIIMMIEKVSKIEFLKDHEMTDLKPQFPNESDISMDVPTSSTGPHSTRSGSTARAPATSSSSSGVLRVLKSMFAWCRDTHQRQDVLLSNQRRQNEKMDIDKFDEFPLPVPPLDDDPFATLSAANIAAMEAAPDANEASSSEYEDDDDGDDDDE